MLGQRIILNASIQKAEDTKIERDPIGEG